MNKKRMFYRRRAIAQFTGEPMPLSPYGPWIRIVHAARLGCEALLALAVLYLLVAPPHFERARSEANAAEAPAAPQIAAAAPLVLAPEMLSPAAVSVPSAATADLGLAQAARAASFDALTAALAPALARREMIETQVRRGDTLRDVLEREGVAPSEFNAAILALNDVFDARTLRAGQQLALFVERGEADAPGLMGLAFEPDVDRTIHIARSGEDFRARQLTTPLTRRVARAQGEITESLYADAKRAGVDDLVIIEIANLLAYTVDFQREIHPGDRFDIVFEQFVNPAGEVVRAGEIYAIAFAPRGRELEYWRYTPPGDQHAGFYDASGESALRFLMRTPVNATRISSGFSAARRHPVLGYTRAHKGTDFAAPRGTPIYAAGNGVVERANAYGSFGNYVRIRHANGYKTIYAHLNGFARGIRAGASVTQGQVIGYVGMTGTATGPHLHYEVHVNDVAINPMTIEAPTGRTLAEAELEGFLAERERLEALRATAAPADSVPARLPEEMVADSETTDHAARRVASSASSG